MRKKRIRDYLVVLVFLSTIVLASNVDRKLAPNTFLFEFLVVVLLWFSLVDFSVRNFKIYSLSPVFKYTHLSLMVLGGAFIGLSRPEIGPHMTPLYIPVAFISLLFTPEIAITSGVVLTFLAVQRWYSDPALFLTFLVVVYSTARTLSTTTRRTDIVRSSFAVSTLSFSSALFVKLVLGISYTKYDLWAAFLNPFVSGILVIGMLPYVEYTSRIYSNMGLEEFGNLNHPLLKMLSMRAPGTYYHSVLVANLAEAAAERINANPVLARIGSYFHDIGKVKRPNFFTENIRDDKNPHDNINPSLSHLILNEHVKYGVELARKYRLPLLVEFIIPQHHGTRSQKYFYYKAKQKFPNVSEEEFRYPGPKPQFKEAAIVMLADSVEAASRSLKNPSVGQIRECVENVISSIFFERQLDESGITLSDLEKISDAFLQALVSLFSTRVEYPDEESTPKAVRINGSSGNAGI